MWWKNTLFVRRLQLWKWSPSATRILTRVYQNLIKRQFLFPCCVSHTLTFQKPSKSHRLIINKSELCSFPDLSLLLCLVRGSSKPRRVEVFSDQSKQDASPVVTVLCSKQFWEQKDLGSHKLQTQGKTVEHGKQIFSWLEYKQGRKHGKGCVWPNSLFMASPDRSHALKLVIAVCIFVFEDGNSPTFVCL